MSQSLRRSISSSRRCANFLGAVFAVLNAALATGAFGESLGCASNIGPVAVGIALDRAVGGVSGTKTLGRGPVSVTWGMGPEAQPKPGT
jgi:hypothetical protein